MNPVIWIPYRATEDRAPLFDKVLEQASSMNIPLIVADSGHEPFSVGNTWNACAEQSKDWDVAVRWGADFIIENIASVWDAIRLATDGVNYVSAFTHVTKLNRFETKRYIDTGQYDRRNHRLPFGGISVIRREAFETVGGYDPRFTGWGHEDRVFRYCLSQLAPGETRVNGRMLMLHHTNRRHTPDDTYYQYQQRNHEWYQEYKQYTGEQLQKHIRSVR